MTQSRGEQDRVGLRSGRIHPANGWGSLRGASQIPSPRIALPGQIGYDFGDRKEDASISKKDYSVSFEIEGPAAIFTRPDSGASFVSYPAPTYSAVKGMFECVARWKTACIRPRRVEICRPIQFHRYATNYGGPLRGSSQISKAAPYQLFATILIDVCYRVEGFVIETAPALTGNNQSHALQELFLRRLQRGQVYQTPCLGWSEFTPTYFGPLRGETKRCDEINLSIPSMLREVFDKDSYGGIRPRFVQNVQIERGVLSFAE